MATDTYESTTAVLDSEQIKNYLPHRYPFLLVDRVTEIKKNESITAYKNITINEPFFNGHFPQKAIMPGVLQAEALAQAAGILILQSSKYEEVKDPIFYFAGIDSLRFKKIVVPGDQLYLHIKVIKSRRTLWKFSAIAKVNGEIACEGDLLLIEGSQGD